MSHSSLTFTFRCKLHIAYRDLCQTPGLNGGKLFIYLYGSQRLSVSR